jgi:hypothetical protein
MRDLLLGMVGALWAISGVACSDPPSPPPVPRANASTAPWVEWRAADAPVRGPVALVVDVPGGPMDRLVADLDVTTFLNDQFHPLFRAAYPGQPAGTVRFYDGCGCPLTPPLTPSTPAAFISLANEVVVRTESRVCEGRVFAEACSPRDGAVDP